jgi:hypothetical protein
MSQWIKVEKDLANDPRVLRMASRLRNADVTLGSRSKLLVIGALVTLWWYADTHISDDDVLPIGADQIDELVGLTGFCEIMPSDWLEIIDANSVKLVGYFAHNGSIAKARALNQRRQETHRNSTAKASRLRNAHVTQDALPDKSREDKTREEKSKNLLVATPPTPAKKVSRETDLDWWLDFKLAYPERAGDQGWREAQRAAHARLAEGHTSSEMIEGAKRYAAFLEATGKLGSEFVKRASTFLGPESPPHFLQSWTPPATKAEARQGRSLSASEQWLADQESRDAVN